jgi:hypothetical protein
LDFGARELVEMVAKKTQPNTGESKGLVLFCLLFHIAARLKRAR